jgi:RNA polymerase sigma factor (sigma-70 family)
MIELSSSDYAWAGTIARLVCRRYGGLHLADDAQSVAYTALWMAARSYDESEGTTLRQYARYRVRGAVIDMIRSELRAVRNALKAATNDRPAANPDAAHIARVDTGRLLSLLRPRNRAVVEEYYFRGETITNLASAYHVNESRAYQIVQKSLHKMRDAVRAA